MQTEATRVKMNDMFFWYTKWYLHPRCAAKTLITIMMITMQGLQMNEKSQIKTISSHVVLIMS
jgi:hypothetical protein